MAPTKRDGAASRVGVADHGERPVSDRCWFWGESLSIELECAADRSGGRWSSAMKADIVRQDRMISSCSGSAACFYRPLSTGAHRVVQTMRVLNAGSLPVSARLLFREA